MKLSKFYVLPLASMVVLIGTLLLGVSTAKSSDFHQGNSALFSAEASDNKVIDRAVLEEGQAFVVQTRSKGVEIIAGARVVTMTENRVVTIEDENGEVIKVFEGFGGGADLIATSAMSEADALRLLKSGGGIVGF
jgi:hypothetical protein